MKEISLWKRFTSCLTEKFCCWQGRATRSEFWSFILFFNIIDLVLVGIGLSLGDGDRHSMMVEIPHRLWKAICFLPLLGVLVRRLHDTGRTAWNLLWNLLPIIGQLILVFFACRDSRHGTNEYGPSEKYPEA